MSRLECPCCWMEAWGRTPGFGTLDLSSVRVSGGVPASSTNRTLLGEGGRPSLPRLCTDFALAAAATHPSPERSGHSAAVFLSLLG